MNGSQDDEIQCVECHRCMSYDKDWQKIGNHWHCARCYAKVTGQGYAKEAKQLRQANQELDACLWWYGLFLGYNWFGRLLRRLLGVRFLVDEAIAQSFHEVYERLAPEFGYKTREASAKPWKDVPKNNKNLMIAVVRELREKGLPWTVREKHDLRMHARPWG